MDVLHLTQVIERALGRKTKSSNFYSDRPIDIDLIRAFEDDGQELFIETPELTIPHRLWSQRDFVKEPLKEIMH